MHLDHTIVPSHDKVGSAKFFAWMMGVEYKSEQGHFAPVEIGNLSFDFDDRREVAHHHYAFMVSDEEFDDIFGRVKGEGLRYGSGPRPENRYDMEINTRRGGRGVYFDDPNGHSIELMTK